MTPSDRLPKLLEAAAAAFVEHGYQRTQMDDVAERLGVSKGTIYRAIPSKEALFAAVIATADDPARAAVPAAVDFPAIASRVRDELADTITQLELAEIVAEQRSLPRASSLGNEVERITAELHQATRARRTAIMVLDRCANEHPELAAAWFGDGRYALVDLWAAYIELRAGVVRSDVDRAILARTIVEIVTTWAVKMPWDKAPRPYPAETAAACAAMVRDLLTGGTS